MSFLCFSLNRSSQLLSITEAKSIREWYKFLWPWHSHRPWQTAGWPPRWRGVLTQHSSVGSGRLQETRLYSLGPLVSKGCHGTRSHQWTVSRSDVCHFQATAVKRICFQKSQTKRKAKSRGGRNLGSRVTEKTASGHQMDCDTEWQSFPSVFCLWDGNI